MSEEDQSQAAFAEAAEQWLARDHLQGAPLSQEAQRVQACTERTLAAITALATHKADLDALRQDVSESAAERVFLAASQFRNSEAEVLRAVHAQVDAIIATGGTTS